MLEGLSADFGVEYYFIRLSSSLTSVGGESREKTLQRTTRKGQEAPSIRLCSTKPARRKPQMALKASKLRTDPIWYIQRQRALRIY
jgi:hypothetical protein